MLRRSKAIPSHTMCVVSLPRTMKNLKLLPLFLILLLINSCTNITKAQAEAKAIQFVNNNVKFFAREENSTLNLPQYTLDSITSYQENKNWIVVMHVSAKAGNETKKNDLLIKLDNKGDVIEFNGKKVPR